MLRDSQVLGEFGQAKDMALLPQLLAAKEVREDYAFREADIHSVLANSNICRIT
jgi:hypothetical protein